MKEIRSLLVNIIVFILIIYITLNIFITKSYAVSQTIETDISKVDSSKYPGITDKIEMLKNEHPNWNFKILYTDLEWKDVISSEYTGHGSSPKNLVPANSSYLRRMDM